MIRLPSLAPVSGVYPIQMMLNSVDKKQDATPIVRSPMDSPIFQERYLSKRVRLHNGKIREDVHVLINDNGKKRERKTHRVLPIPKRNRSVGIRRSSREPTKKLRRVKRHQVRINPVPIHLTPVSAPPPVLESPPPLTIRNEPQENFTNTVQPSRFIQPTHIANTTITNTNTPLSPLSDRMPTPSSKLFTDKIKLLKTEHRVKTPRKRTPKKRAPSRSNKRNRSSGKQ
jgi:hypothetical protein